MNTLTTVFVTVDLLTDLRRSVLIHGGAIVASGPVAGGYVVTASWPTGRAAAPAHLVLDVAS